MTAYDAVPKRSPLLRITNVVLPLIAVCLAVPQASGETLLEYDLIRGKKAIGYQSVKISKAVEDGKTLTRVLVKTRIETSVLLYKYRFTETLDAFFDGAKVARYAYECSTNGKKLSIDAAARKGVLKVQTTRKGKTKVYSFPQKAYDIHTWSTYLDPERSYAPAKKGQSRIVRVFIVEEGELQVRKVRHEGHETISLMGGPHRALHLRWRKKVYANHTWHADKYKSIPARYTCNGLQGAVTFELKRPPKSVKAALPGAPRTP